MLSQINWPFIILTTRITRTRVQTVLFMETPVKTIFSLVLLAIFLTASAYAAPFTPPTLRLSAPSSISYHFDGSELRIPLTVTGTPAEVIFSVFTRNYGQFISPTRNGYLGWHYVKPDRHVHLHLDTVSLPERPQRGRLGWTVSGRQAGVS